MQPVQQGERYAVFDDFLAPEPLALLREAAAAATYREFDSVVDARVDGPARRTRGGVFAHDAQIPAEGSGAGVAAIRAAVMSHPEIYGQAGSAWSVLSFALWQYGAGTRLGWHNDAGNGRTGEFILYVHDEWRPSWGGELLVLDRFAPIDVANVPSSQRYLAIEDFVAASSAPLVAIPPKPNRLVMVRAGTCHYINRVDAAAGVAKRRSLTGFCSLPTRSANSTGRESRINALLSWGEAAGTTGG